MYISKYFWQRPNMIKFVELLTTEHRKTLVKLGIFVEKAFQIKKTNNAIVIVTRNQMQNL